jgi:hypothetical protein
LAIIPLPALVDEGQEFGAVYDALGALAQSPDVAAEEARTLVSGVLSLNESRNVLVETESGGSLDQLTHIDLDTLPANLVVRLGVATLGHDFDIVHLASAGGGDGEFSLHAVDEAGGTLRFDSLEKTMDVERRGDTIYELRRNGFGGAGVGGTLSADLDGDDHTVRRVRWNERNVTPVSGGYVVTLDDSGDWLNMRAEATVTLPNPNALDGSGRSWLAGHTVALQQWGSLLQAITHTGASPNHPLNHDRAMGTRAVIQVKVCEENDGTLAWRLMGETKIPPGGTTPDPDPPPADSKIRTFIDSSVLANVSTSSASTAWTDCGSYSHTPGASEKWVYLFNFGFYGSGSNSQNGANARVVNAAAASTALCSVGRPRYSTHTDRLSFIWGATYGGSPVAQTFRLEAANGATGYTVTTDKPRLFGIKLETDEDYAVQSGVVSDSGQTYDTVVTMTKTLPAGNYYIIAGFGVETSTSHHFSAKLTVAGVDVGETVGVKNHPSKGYWQIAHKAAALSGSVTITSRIKSDTAGGSATATDGIIILLKAANFQVVDSASDLTETTTTSTTAATKISETTTLQSSWRSLVIASQQVYLDAEGSSTHADTYFQRNGTDIVPVAKQSSRLFSGEAAGYCATSYMGLSVMSQQLTNDVFNLKIASANGTDTVKAKHATLLFLALAPL